MELLAIAETSRRSMVPERFGHLSAEEVNQKLRALRAELMLLL